MAVRNVERFLAEAIESILMQTFTDFEFIIVDFGSTDQSLTIALSYAARDPRIRICETPPCSLPEARNVGGFCAKGRFIAVMDADDVSLPERLDRELEYLNAHPRVALLGAAVEWIDSSGRPFHVHGFHPTSDHEIKSQLRTHNVFWHPTMIMRRESFTSLGGYRAAFVCSHDYDLAARIAERYECANLREVLVRYRVHPHQLTAARQTEQTVCKLAVHVSAAARRAGTPDPIATLLEITPATLAALGVGEREQRNAAIADGHTWIRNMISAGEYASASASALRILKSNLDHVDPWRVSELHLSVAGLYWKDRKLWKCATEVVRAILARPVLVGRPIMLLLRKLRWA
jgi:glycosyltransferase involved in cell wall biosynthesis